MTEVLDLSSNTVVADGTFRPHHQYGLFATAAYSEGDVILTESPLVVSSAPSSLNVIRSQFNDSSLATSAPAAAGKSKSTDEKSLSILADLILPPTDLEQISSATSSQSLNSRTSRLRGMLLALASYATNPPSEDVRKKLFELYHPSINDEGVETKNALELAKLALQCGKKMAAQGSALSSLLQTTDGSNLLLIYSCNAFEGGRIYHRLSRVNHSCNPNAVVVEGGGLSRGASDVSVLKAGSDIALGDEINISYLGKYLFAGYPTRQWLLRENKHFACRCVRCNGNDVSKTGCDAKSNKGINGDLASRIPCPICHPRTGRFLDDDVMFDEGCNDEDALKVDYAIPNNGLAAEERHLHCPSCKGTTAFVPTGVSMRKKKEGMAIKYMSMAEDKIYDRLESSGNDCSSSDKTKQKTSSDDTETERDIDQQFLQMATSICGAQHWTTHFLNLSLIEESLVSFHSTLMTMGQDSNKDAEMMEELFVEIAEAADGIERAYAFASSLELNLDPAHWLFDYTVGLARALVGLGDVKSQKYGAEWISKVEKYSEKFENDGMNKVVLALRDAWKREGNEDTEMGSESSEIQEEQEGCKRMKIG